MKIRRNQHMLLPFPLGDEVLEEVNQFKYLGAWINNKIDPDQGIKARIGQDCNVSHQ